VPKLGASAWNWRSRTLSGIALSWPRSCGRPSFDDWDRALPRHIGAVDTGCEGYVLNDVVAAVRYMREHSAWDRGLGYGAKLLHWRKSKLLGWPRRGLF
jgi:hypothetical protein